MRASSASFGARVEARDEVARPEGAQLGHLQAYELVRSWAAVGKRAPRRQLGRGWDAAGDFVQPPSGIAALGPARDRGEEGDGVRVLRFREQVARRIDARAPQTRREKTSRPSSSLPSRCRQDGWARTRLKSV
jgi:hypothetical protein